MKLAIHRAIDFLTRNARAFVRAKRGNVAMMFGIASVPLLIAVGAGVDFFRAAMVKNAMNEAIDAAALAIGSTQGLNTSSAQSLAQQYFNANYKTDSSFGTPTVTVTNYDSTKGTVTITATDQMPATLLKVVGYNPIGISASSTVVWGQSKIWVALVLDNSGSMAQGDSTGTKMDALKNGSKQLLTTLQGAAANEGDVKVTIVPFSDTVSASGSIATTYVDWREWDAQPPLDSGYMTETVTMSNGIPFQAYGPGAPCPFDGTDGYYCQATSANTDECSYDNKSSCISNVPLTGLICPSMHGYSKWTDGSPDRFYNGCYTSVIVTGSNSKVSWTGKSTDCSRLASGVSCTCNSSGSCSSQRYTHVWTVNAHSGWSGCITDRQRSGATTYGASSPASQDYDTYNTTPSSGDTLFPALETDSCVGTAVLPLPASWSSSQWTTLSNKIDSMSPGGSTNQAIGIEHGWQTLTPGAPYGAPTVPANTSRYLIVFSDGQNTQQARWYGNGRTEGNAADGYIDTRTTDACAHAKADGFIIYSVYVNVGGNSGNSAPLQTCASDSSKYFALTSTSAIVTTFNQIAQQITNVRVSK